MKGKVTRLQRLFVTLFSLV